MEKADTARAITKGTEDAAACPVGLSSGNPCEKGKDKRPRKLRGQTIKIRSG